MKTPDENPRRIGPSEELRFFRRAVDSASDAIGMSTPDGRHYYQNQAFDELFGMTVTEVEGATGPPSTVYADEQVGREVFGTIMGGTPWTGEVEMLGRDGRRLRVLLRAYAVKDDGGAVVGLVGVHTDITEQRQVEADLRSVKRQTEFILGATKTGIDVIDSELNIRYIDPEWQKVYGDPTGRKCYQYFMNRDDVCPGCGVLKALETKKGAVTQEVLPRENNRPVQVTTMPFQNEQGEWLVAEVNTDITDRLTLEAQLRQAQKLESIGTLAGGVAHEINNPIMGIMNYAQLIKDQVEGSGGMIEEFADEIIHETKRVATLVRNLLAFARQEKQSHSAARICDIVEGTLLLIRTVMLRDRITLEVDVPGDLPPVKCRTQQIQQVLMNLLTNARDALNAKYPDHHEDKLVKIVSRQIEKDREPWIRTTVEDHGAGIAPETRERMFDPFFTTKPRDAGTGLGLSINHGIVQDHGGELAVESEVGQYTRFHLDLPVDNGWALD